MDPIASRQTKIIFGIFISLVVISLGVTYYRYMVKRDFNVVTEEQ